MKNRRYIVYFLMVISVIMLVAPLIPHHHHSNGIICMKDDIKDVECPHHHHHHHHHNDDPCCTSDCMTTFESSVPTQQLDEVQPQYFYITTLFTEPLLRFLTTLEEYTVHRSDHVYLESLHGTFITRATGLRAPPYLFTI